MILRVLLVLTLLRGILCPEMRPVITVGFPALISPCTSKSRAGIDIFFFNGTIGNNVRIHRVAAYDMLLPIHLYEVKQRTGYIVYCTLVIRDYTCEAWSYNGCSCQMTKSLKLVHFVINYTLNATSSLGTFHVHWKSKPNIRPLLPTIHSDKNYSLPEICDVKTARLTLTIDGVVRTLPRTTSCSFTMILDTSNSMQLCCSDMAMPCYSQISVHGTVVATNESPCVSYTPSFDVAGISGTIELSYSVCTQTDYMLGSYCTIRTGVVTERFTISTTAVVTTANVVTTADDVDTSEITKATDADTPEVIETTTGVNTTEIIGTTSALPPAGKSSTFQIVPWVALLLALLVINGLLATLYVSRRTSRHEAAALVSQYESQQNNLPKDEVAQDEEVKVEKYESKVSVRSFESQV